MPDNAFRPTLRGDKTTDIAAPMLYAAARVTVVSGRSTEQVIGYYLFPSPQRTTRPGLPGQTRRPRAP